MVEPVGHVATALLFAVPAWLLWGRRPAVTFTVLTQVTSVLPDVDIYLREYFSHPLNTTALPTRFRLCWSSAPSSALSPRAC